MEKNILSSANIAEQRNRDVVRRTIKNFSLNLSGLTVFTEAATGNYRYTPVVAGLAGADQVFAVTRDSRYGKKEEVKNIVMSEAKEFGVDRKISVLFDKTRDSLSKSDIITNSGFVRPITSEMISWLKPTAVIPLMWETWEFRAEDLDLEACRKKGVLVMGTNEHHPMLNLFRSIGFLICKLLFEKGLSVYKDNILLISSGLIGDSTSDFFINAGISFNRVSFDDRVPPHQKPYLLNRDAVLSRLGSYDAIIIAEHNHNVDVLSNRGFITTGLLKKENPLAQIIHICGTVSKNDIQAAGLEIYPDAIMPFGYMTVSLDYLGIRTLVELNTAGLKVGEVMARCRLKGLSIKETIDYTLKNSPAMDFK